VETRRLFHVFLDVDHAPSTAGTGIEFGEIGVFGSCAVTDAEAGDR
jgi:hypothetical protein